MPRVTFLPSNITVDVNEGVSILDVALDNNVPIMHACGGYCACTTCHIRVQLGSEEGSLSPRDAAEIERVEGDPDFGHDSRLACQSKILGNVVVEVVNPE